MLSQSIGWSSCLLVAALTFGLACGETQPTATEVGHGGSFQGGAAQGGSSQGGASQGGASQGGSSQGGSDCSGACSTHDLQASFGAATAKFSRAQYGLTAPAKSTSGKWEFYLEAHEGGDAGCPTKSSPTPKHTMILAGLLAPLPTQAQAEAQGVKVSLLDFDGALLGVKPISKATAVVVTPTASQICTACVGQGADASGYAALDIQATFDEGTISGHIYATHCASLDVP